MTPIDILKYMIIWTEDLRTILCFKIRGLIKKKILATS